MTKSVKLSDIAQRLNVSTVTISKALNGKSGVSDELRAEIIKLADEMGYQSPSSKNMKKINEGKNIGVIVSEIYLEKYLSFYWEMYRHLAAYTSKKENFSILEVLAPKDEDDLVLPNVILENRVDGLIVLGKLSDGYLSKLQKKNIPIVFLDFYDSRFSCDCVISNNFYGMYKMTNYLVEQGHREIAFVGRVLATNSITDRYFGYMKAMIENGLEVKEDWVIDDRGMGSGKIENIMLPKTMPTAFACNCDYAAGELIRVLNQNGYQVPEDISVVGFDNYIFPGLSDIEITTYEVDMKEMAKISVNLLLRSINHDNLKKGVHIVEGSIITKESVKKIN